MSRLYTVYQLLWLAFGGNEIKPAAGHHQIWPQSQDAVSDRIAMVMIVEKPGAELALAKRRLNGVEVHGSILRKNRVIGSSGGSGEVKTCGFRRLALGIRPESD